MTYTEVVDTVRMFKVSKAYKAKNKAASYKIFYAVDPTYTIKFTAPLEGQEGSPPPEGTFSLQEEFSKAMSLIGATRKLGAPPKSSLHRVCAHILERKAFPHNGDT